MASNLFTESTLCFFFTHNRTKQSLQVNHIEGEYIWYELLL